jgi:hypothetical protein
MKTRAELAITPAAADRWASKLCFDDSVELASREVVDFRGGLRGWKSP